MARMTILASAMFVGLSAGSICDAAPAAPHDAIGAMRLCEVEMKRASAKFGVPLGVLYSVGLTETGRKGSLHPYALNIEGRGVFAVSHNDAKAKFEEARRSGAKLIDLGCMQINHHFHREKFVSLDQMLNPRDNVEYAARFLKELKDRHQTWSMAVARYHAGPNNDPAQKQYICKVITNMVATGFGNWTPAAKTFCLS